ncbi:XisH family protein [Nostoc sp.]|uniref:XisH family protein n=1 Tax=Nostoc sp. TaxID=1180 RepID=UPI002FF617FA
MPALDIFHDVVKRALEKDGWLITILRFGGLDMYIDLGAGKILAAERDEEKIAVEVKSFVSPFATTEFSTALGQFLKYQLALEEKQPHRVLYLAVPFDTYRSFFTLELPRLVNPTLPSSTDYFRPRRGDGRQMAKVEQYRQIIQELLQA